MAQRSTGVEAASLPPPLEITPEVGHLQADTQTNEITLRTALHALVGLLPAMQGESHLCAWGLLGVHVIGPTKANASLLPHVALCRTSILCPSPSSGDE